jgi:hypothetical protein
MTQTNEVVRTLFANFPIAELGSDEQRRVFDSLKTRFGQTPDAAVELKNLFKVKGFSDFAAVLMWILERAKKDPQLAATSPEDETLLLSTFRRALGDPGSSSAPAASAGVGTGAIDERDFASQLERFSEVVQSGTKGRGALLESLLNGCDRIVSRTLDDEFKQFGSLLGDFLKYIAEGELLDDVRVINIVSNISSSVSQWAISPPEARHGLMEEALGMLRDFRTHFE